MGRFTVNGGEVWHKQHQGPDTGMDADTVDGQHAAALLPSDRRIKKDIGPIEQPLSLDTIQELLVAYRYTDENHPQQRYGVIAQSLLEHPALAELVRTQAVAGGATLSVEFASLLFYMINTLSVELAEAKRQIAVLQEGQGHE